MPVLLKPHQKSQMLELLLPANRPGACRQFDRSLCVGWQRLPQSLANRRSDLFITTREVVRRGALPRQKRFPIIIKISKASYYVESMDGQVFEIRLLKKTAQPFLRTHRETLPLVGRGRFAVDRNSDIPEFPQEPRALRVVPNVNRHGAAGTGDAAEFF